MLPRVIGKPSTKKHRVKRPQYPQRRSAFTMNGRTPIRSMVATNLARASIAARTAGIADHTGNHAFSKLPKPHPPKEQTADATNPCHRRPAIRKAVPKLSQSG
jgi:hypothetical protein